jgi:hypothetical protein
MIKKAILLCGLLSLINCQSSIAQTNAPSPATNAPPGTAQSFLQSVEGYVSSFDTNLWTFRTNGNYKIWTGIEYQQSINEGAALGVEAEPFSKVPWLMLGDKTVFAGTVGTAVSEELNVGWNKVYIDTEFTAGLCGADVFHPVNGYPAGLRGGVFVEIKKAMTANTFMGLRLTEEWGKGRGQQPPVTVFAGFTF